MTNQPPLNPDAPDSQVSEYQRVEVIETPARDYPSHGSVTIRLYHSERQSTAIQIAERTAESLRDQLNGYVAVAQPESEDERIPAWQAVANHPAFNDCYEEERPLLESMLDHLTELAAKPEVNSVEEADNLPVGSVIILRNGTARMRTDWSSGWASSKAGDDYPTDDRGCFPARVLYRPESS